MILASCGPSYALFPTDDLSLSGGSVVIKSEVGIMGSNLGQQWHKAVVVIPNNQNQSDVLETVGDHLCCPSTLLCSLQSVSSLIQQDNLLTSWPEGGINTVACKPGYVFSVGLSSLDLICNTSSGTGSTVTVPSCYATPCSVLNVTIDNGHYSTLTGSTGTISLVHCAAGYHVSGPYFLKCTGSWAAGGQDWVGNVAFCIPYGTADFSVGPARRLLWSYDSYRGPEPSGSYSAGNTSRYRYSSMVNWWNDTLICNARTPYTIDLLWNISNPCNYFVTECSTYSNPIFGIQFETELLFPERGLNAVQLGEP